MKHQLEKKTVPRETFELIDQLYQKNVHKLEQYIEKLLWWNDKVNLISRNLSREDLKLHIKHSLLPLGLFDFKLDQKLIDAGTGGGLPGIPLAVCLSRGRLTLNDISTKKMLAVKDIGRKLQLSNIDYQIGDIAELELKDYQFVISKHAFKIPEIVKTLTHIDTYNIILYKGIDIEKEVAGLESPHQILIYDISAETGNTFFKGKSIVTISPLH